MLDIIMNTPPEEVVDIKSLKEHVHESAKEVQDDEGNYDLVRDQLREKAKVQLMGGADTGNLKVPEPAEKPVTDAPEEASAARGPNTGGAN